MRTSVKPAMAGMGLTGRGTSMAVGSESCILIRTRGTPTCVPARYTLTHGLHYWSDLCSSCQCMDSCKILIKFQTQHCFSVSSRISYR